MRDPEYERAEQTWVDGKPLEAIEMMREYLKRNPRANSMWPCALPRFTRRT
jgi:hypothetical protein